MSRGGEESEIGWAQTRILLAEPKRPPNAFHPIPPEPIAPLPCALSLAAALCGRFPALAADKPATPEGADALKAFFAKYLPAAQAGAPPLVTVTPEGADYLISADLSALNALLKETGVSYDPATIVYKAVEQDDGNWRVAMDSLPKIGFHSKDATGSLELTNFRSAALIDPAIAWLLSGSASMDKGTFKIQTPKIDPDDRFRPRSGDDRDQCRRRRFGFDAGEGGHRRPRPESDRRRRQDDAPVNFSGRSDKALVNLGVDGFKSRKAFDLWGLLAAHPPAPTSPRTRPELKGLLKELAAPGLKFSEGIEAQKVVVTASLGAIALGGCQISAWRRQRRAAELDQPQRFSRRIEPAGWTCPAQRRRLDPVENRHRCNAQGSTSPPPPTRRSPTCGSRATGRLLSDENADKVAAALLSAGPLRIEFAPSHSSRPRSTRTSRGHPPRAQQSERRNHDPRAGFDKTMAAVKDMGPDITGKAIPASRWPKGSPRAKATAASAGSSN